LWDSQGWKNRVGTTDIRPREPYQFLKKTAAILPRLDDVKAYLETGRRDSSPASWSTAGP
jgi:hypothetical protein